jgi:predicted nucleic acid-binding protein
VSGEIWDGEGLVLADTSAWIVARRVPGARELFLAAVERAEVAWCWPVRYELMVDARSIESIEVLDRTLERLREIAVDRAVQRGVLSAMRELAGGGSHGAHRLPLADLTVAVAAQQSGLPVLHHDRHFGRLAELLGIDARWITEPMD